MQDAIWYFDVVSPFAYLQWQRVKQLQQVKIAYRPIMFAGILNHLDHKGPGEMADKRLFTYRHFLWRAERAGVPVQFPPAHPFNPLGALRLCVAAGATLHATDTIFDFIWREGNDPSTQEALRTLGTRLGLEDGPTAAADPAVKAQLQRNFELALTDRVFGVPSLVINGQVFWGEDATDMFLDFLADPTLFERPAMKQLDTLPVGASRTGR